MLSGERFPAEKHAQAKPLRSYPGWTEVEKGFDPRCAWQSIPWAGASGGGSAARTSGEQAPLGTSGANKGWAGLWASLRLRRASPEHVPLGAEVLLAHPVSRRLWEALGLCKWLWFPGLRCLAELQMCIFVYWSDVWNTTSPKWDSSFIQTFSSSNVLCPWLGLHPSSYPSRSSVVKPAPKSRQLPRSLDFTPWMLRVP